MLTNIIDKVYETSVEQMVRSILLSIVNCRSSTEIAEKIIENVSADLTNEQKSYIDDAAKALHKIQEPDVILPLIRSSRFFK